jgi:CHAT domain-containing protein/tetratricopeptide (TPR) repeat protein
MSQATRLRVLDEAARETDLHERCNVLAAAQLDDARGLTWLVGQIGERVQTEPKVAEALAEACVLLATRVDAYDAAAAANYQWARVLAASGQPDRALHLIDVAQAQYMQCGHELQALRTGLGRMHVLDDFGRHLEAVVVGEEVLSRLGSLSTAESDSELSSWLRGATLENLGVAYGFTDAHERAVGCYAQAADIYQTMEMAGDLARVRANQGIELVEIGHAAEGLALLRSSATQFEIEGDRLWLGKCLGHQAAAHMALGSYLDALSLLEQARSCLAELGVQTESTRLTALLAEVSIALALHTEAFDLANTAASVFRENSMTHDLAHALRWCGVACLNTNRLDEAFRLFEEARSLFSIVGATSRSAETALALAALLNRSGRSDLALAETRVACDQLADGDSRAAHAFALMHLADLSDESEQRAHLDAAAVIVAQLHLPPLSWHLHLRLGRSMRHTGDLEQAKFHLNHAVEIIEGLQGTVPDEALRAIFLGDKSDAFDELADLLLSLPEPDIHGAFAVRERARSRSLSNSGNDGSPRRKCDVDESIAQHGRELAGVYNSLLRSESTGPKQHMALIERAAELERHITVLRLQRLGAVDRPVDLTALPSFRNAATKTVLVYEIIGDTIHAFVSSGNELAHRKLPTAASVVACEIEELERQWTHFQFGTRFATRNRSIMISTTQAVLRSLHDHLVAPVEDLLGPVTPGSSVVVVPSGSLHRIPFNALTARHHDDSDCDDPLNRVFTMAPRLSLASPPSLNATTCADLRRPLVMGVSDETTPCATNEARCVASKLHDPLLYLDGDATVARLREHAPSASVIHLACHGLHRADNPLFSSLQLADGWISALDILDLPLRDATVVLSACESGRQQSNGAEPLGLSWAFLGAGATAVLVSLWTVQDDVASYLMSAFYDQLNDGADHAHALQSAQQATAALWPHPYYWASFVLVGSAGEPSHRRLQ